MIRRTAPAAALLLAGVLALAACTPPAAAPTAWQSTVQTVAQQASTGDYASALASLDALEAEVVARRDAGEITAEEADGILSRIATVRADLTSLVPVPSSTPTPTSTPTAPAEPAPSETQDSTDSATDGEGTVDDGAGDGTDDGTDEGTDGGADEPRQNEPTDKAPTDKAPSDKAPSDKGPGDDSDKAPGGKESAGPGKKDG